MAEDRRAGRSTGSWDLSEYAVVRRALLDFGTSASEFLRARSADGELLLSRVIASGLRFELEHPDEARVFYTARGKANLALNLALTGRKEK